MVLISIVAVIIYRILVSIPLFQSDTFRPMAQGLDPIQFSSSQFQIKRQIIGSIDLKLNTVLLMLMGFSQYVE